MQDFAMFEHDRQEDGRERKEERIVVKVEKIEPPVTIQCKAVMHIATVSDPDAVLSPLQVFDLRAFQDRYAGTVEPFVIEVFGAYRLTISEAHTLAEMLFTAVNMVHGEESE